MGPDAEIVLRAFGKWLALAALVCLGVLLVLADVLVLDDVIGEVSLTEIGQELLLLGIVLMFWGCSRRPGYFGFGILVGGFFACLLVRELDALFDLVIHGLWAVPAYGLALVCGTLAWRDRAATLPRLAEFATKPCFGVMAAALTVILVFSRFFGIPELWQHMFSDAYVRVAKNAIEEGSEILGYCLCFGATADYVRGLPKRNAAQPARHNHAT